MKKQTLEELGEQYEKAAGDMTEIIHRLTGEIHRAESGGAIMEAARLRQKRRAFYACREDIRKTAARLKFYYRIKSRGAETTEDTPFPFTPGAA